MHELYIANWPPLLRGKESVENNLTFWYNAYYYSVGNVHKVWLCDEYIIPGAHEEKERISHIYTVVLSKNKVTLADSHSC